MSIIFTSDWHWDCELSGQSRNEEILNCIKQVVRAAKDRNCKNIFVAGDIMHHPRYKGPGSLSGFASMINYMYEEIPDLHLYILKGNHDWDGLPALGMFRSKDLTIISEPSVVHIDDIDIIAVPFMRKIQLEGDRYIDIISKLSSQATNHNRIVVVHAALEGTMVGENEEVVQADALQECGAALGILGHIHKHTSPQKNWYYTGSLIRCTFGEEGEKSGIYYYDILHGLEDIPIQAREVINLHYATPDEAIKKISSDVALLRKEHPGAMFKINVPGASNMSDVIEEAGKAAERLEGDAEKAVHIVKYDYTIPQSEKKKVEAEDLTFLHQNDEPLIMSMKDKLSVTHLWSEYCQTYNGLSSEEKSAMTTPGGALLDNMDAQDMWSFMQSGKLDTVIERIKKAQEERHKQEEIQTQSKEPSFEDQTDSTDMSSTLTGLGELDVDFDIMELD